jgi:Mn2+/Fe2+ NRAMP family transporter
MARFALLACIVLGAAAMAAMTVGVFTWMTVPSRIVYRESSPAQSDSHSVEVREHGQSYYLTPAQKRELDRVRTRTPVIMLGGFVVVFLAIVAGAAARLRIKGPAA